ncbi:MAG: cell division ATP-binding protein FtsE [Candidatus Sericytochromatia bacterium]|nr:cell division ATP-binding protein FtsE [Candidatus Sericytochromatia bacterium]
MIQLQQVRKVYSNGVQALQGINLKIKMGEFVFLVGPSGSGKSTLTKLLYREELPTSGQVFLAGVNIGELRPRQVPTLRQRVGVVFQDFKLLPKRTVWENVAFSLEILGISAKEQHQKVKAALELTGIVELAQEYPTRLSGGEQQRVSLARAIVNSPPLLLADEPTGNLDPDTSWEIMRLLTKINLRGTTVLVSTHDKLIVDSMRRRVVTIERGRLVQDQAQGVYSVGIS